MDLKKIHNVYFVGIGGIGMSALARYFNTIGKTVAGYDRSFTALTENLEKEGMRITYTDKISEIPVEFRQNDSTLVVYTPAIPVDSEILNYFKNEKFPLYKRAEVLGILTANYKAIAIAGTHGKTTTTTLTAHILRNSELDCNAFLGGIAKNYSSNLLLSKNSEFVVVEADEYDRSFLHLFPHIAVITAIDADHLDIYGTHEAVKESFADFTKNIHENGYLIVKKGVEARIKAPNSIKIFSYALDSEADFFAKNIRLENSIYFFDLKMPNETIANCSLGMPGIVNVENAVAASASAYLAGVPAENIRKALASFSGVQRRFDIQYKSDKTILIDDYAHHPEELKAIITSVRNIYKGKKLSGLFQPHLYSRTRDFANEFADSLSLLDEVFLLDIYPARELPIEGINSKMILNKVRTDFKKLCSKEDFLNEVKTHDFEVIITIGAGDIDKLLPQITEILKGKN